MADTALETIRAIASKDGFACVGDVIHAMSGAAN